MAISRAQYLITSNFKSKKSSLDSPLANIKIRGMHALSDVNRLFVGMQAVTSTQGALTGLPVLTDSMVQCLLTLTQMI